ncbi:MAG: DUF3810 domain-containing protein [Eubacterium sp.]|nr:DUF3810 domain-containing protein [Eubacterium sp.]
MRNRLSYWKWMMLLGIVIALLNLLALSNRFVEAHHLHIYSGIAGCYGKLTEFIPVNVGEIMMYAAAGFVILHVALLVALIFLRSKERYRTFVKRYSKGMLLGTAVVLLVYTITWSVPFHYSIDLSGDAVAEYTLGDLEELRTYIVETLNEAADEIDRDEDGNIIYDEDMEELVTGAMQEISDEFPYLKGEYPSWKAAYCSDFLEWMNIAGYTYPYTMEVTYNKYTMSLYVPVLMAHEMSHHKGYYKEDDANFLSEIACIKSGEPYLVYSGCLDAYYYVDKAYKQALYSSLDEETADALWQERQLASAQVGEDLAANREAKQKAYDAEEHAAESFSQAAQSVSEVGWDVQSDILEEDCYDGVVGLLLQYDMK